MLPELRSQGLGSVLLDWLEGYVSKAGFTEVGLSVAEVNEKAPRLWGYCGFEWRRLTEPTVSGEKTH